MTHALHRMGAAEDLTDDFTIIVRPGRGRKGATPKLQAILDLIVKHGAVNISGARGEDFPGTSLETDVKNIRDNLKDNHSLFATFKSAEDITSFLKDMVAQDFGLSLVIQGLQHSVAECCKSAGTKPHTVNNSLGFWGATSSLPPQSLLEFTTMCGHSMIPATLVTQVGERVKSGSLGLDEAVRVIAKPCVCGIFNPVRARRLLKRLVES